MSGAPPYAGLSPDVVLACVGSLGLQTDGRLLALNSYENRVYQVGLDDTTPIVAKFYRPNRWSDAAIAEEHAFVLELAAAELPVVAPVGFDGATLHRHGGFRFALYPRRGGRAPQLESAEHLQWMGRLIARMHAIGACARFEHRGRIDVATFLHAPAASVLASTLLPAHLATSYRAATDALAAPLDAAFANAGASTLRLHGDCHPGNVLWTDHGPHFVDIDDVRTGPAVQDLWMLATERHSLDVLIEGYEEFRPFDRAELSLIEPLRMLRQVHWAGWLATRWHDPAFPAAFPYAADARLWEQHHGDLEQAARAFADE
jgi:Ser/Thr protein kinase RdoA (MazF antagonist)